MANLPKSCIFFIDGEKYAKNILVKLRYLDTFKCLESSKYLLEGLKVKMMIKHMASKLKAKFHKKIQYIIIEGPFIYIGKYEL